MAETDNPWKQGLDELSLYALRYFRPIEAAKLRLTRKSEALESEIQPMLPNSQTGVKRVDKLLKVWRKVTRDGRELREGAEDAEFHHFEVYYQ